MTTNEAEPPTVDRLTCPDGASAAGLVPKPCVCGSTVVAIIAIQEAVVHHNATIAHQLWRRRQEIVDKGVDTDAVDV